MSLPSSSALIESVAMFRASEESIRDLTGGICSDVLARSSHIRVPNFRSIAVADLAFLFDVYDERFLGGRCRRALDGRDLTFRLAPRLLKAAGTTTHFQTRAGVSRYEIAVATSVLFDNFRDGDRDVEVCGHPCETRLDALQRIFEHEIVHLIENLCWNGSKCSAPRFQDIAGRLFLHRAHTHQLITRRERAAGVGIRAGSRVTFLFEGRRLAGVVNRVTRRATVLVEDPGGLRYSNGRRYLKYYVPLSGLQLAEPETPRE